MIPNFYIALVAILLLPIIPAFIIYKFLDKNGNGGDEVGGETGGIGPLKGLSWKLKGAFAGYFLLVCVGGALQYFQSNNDLQKEIESLKSELKLTKDSLVASSNPLIDWHIKGTVKPGEKEGTKFFFDDGTTKKDPTGAFELVKRTLKNSENTGAPKWVCIYNKDAGYKVISLNRDFTTPHPDILSYKVIFDDQNHTIVINNPIDINSKSKDSLVAVANFIESKPEIKAKLEESDRVMLREANILKSDLKLNDLKIDRFEKTKVRARIINN